MHGSVISGANNVPSTVVPVSKAENNSGTGISQSVDASTEVEKMPPPRAITIVADGNIINPSYSTTSKTSPSARLATGGVPEADPMYDIIAILQNEVNPPEVIVWPYRFDGKVQRCLRWFPGLISGLLAIPFPGSIPGR